MSVEASKDITQVLADIRAGQAGGRAALLELVYDELRRLAGGLMNRERTGHTWQSTDLVHEALMRLLDDANIQNLQNRRHFFGAAARAMRRLLVDYARQRATEKRGGKQERVPLDDVLEPFEQQHIDLVALDEALDELARMNERQSQVVMLRFFGGLTVNEIAEQLEVSIGTVENDFRIARAWLRSKLGSAACTDTQAQDAPT